MVSYQPILGNKRLYLCNLISASKRCASMSASIGVSGPMNEAPLIPKYLRLTKA